MWYLTIALTFRFATLSVFAEEFAVDCNISAKRVRQYCDTRIYLYRNCPSKTTSCDDIGNNRTEQNCKACCSVKATSKTSFSTSPVQDVNMPTKHLKSTLYLITRRHTENSQGVGGTNNTSKPKEHHLPPWAYAVIITAGFFVVAVAVIVATRPTVLILARPIEENPKNSGDSFRGVEVAASRRSEETSCNLSNSPVMTDDETSQTQCSEPIDDEDQQSGIIFLEQIRA